MEETETTIHPPSNPLTVKINLAILDYYFGWFCKKYLPAFKTVITSGYRDAAKNTAVDGAQNSAHLHGLAYDFVLKYPNGEIVPRSQAKAIYDEFIAPSWAGFSLFELESNNGYHVHVNLSRRVTEYASIMAVAGMGIIGFAIMKSIGDKHE